MALIVTKNKDGSVEMDVPDEHVFSARWLEREIESGLVEVFIRLNANDEATLYKMEGFAVDDEDESKTNLTGWHAVKTSEKEAKL